MRRSQVLFDSSEEGSAHIDGLGLFKGRVVALPGDKLSIGIKPTKIYPSDSNTTTLDHNKYFFCHRYGIPVGQHTSGCFEWTHDGKDYTFSSIVKDKRAYGLQYRALWHQWYKYL